MKAQNMQVNSDTLQLFWHINVIRCLNGENTRDRKYKMVRKQKFTKKKKSGFTNKIKQKTNFMYDLL